MLQLKIGLLTLLLLSESVMAQTQPATSSQQPPIPGGASVEAQKQVHLGVSLTKPNRAMYAQLPQLPKGSGFLLVSLTEGGSLDAAGLKPMDIIWKLDDQILINENQLLTLLSHYQPGDYVKIAYYHSGKLQVAKVKLQKGSQNPPRPELLTLSPPLPKSPVFMRVISYENRSASISDAHGSATLTVRDGKPWLHVESPQGVETFNGPVAQDQDLARVPAIWRSRLPILQRSLQESARLRRLPRVRRVPSPKHRFAADKSE